MFDVSKLGDPTTFQNSGDVADEDDSPQQEWRALVRYYAGKYYESHYASWVYSYCFGDEWEHRMYANDMINEIEAVIGHDAVDEEFRSGRQEFVARQDPMLWRMYQCGVEPARCKHGFVLKPTRFAGPSDKDQPCTCSVARAGANPDTVGVPDPPMGTSEAAHEGAEATELRSLVIPIVTRLFHSSDADPGFATQLLCHENPGIEEKYEREDILEMFREIVHSEDAIKSAEYQALFHEFNRAYFGGRLPDYRVRVVYHIQRFVREQIGSINGLHRVKNRTIYVRVLRDDAEMRGVLVHEMAHAATLSGHDDRFWAEMRRLHAEGAPVDERDFRLAHFRAEADE